MTSGDHGDRQEDVSSASLGASLPCYNERFLKHMKELRLSRDKVMADIRRESGRKRDLEEALKDIKCELDEVDRSLRAKTVIKAELEKTIEDGEKNFRRIVESTEALVGVLQRDSEKIQSAIGLENDTAAVATRSSQPDPKDIAGLYKYFLSNQKS